MTKQKSTKRALLMSALSLLMCVSMLIGSTFAWFTDSVTSGNNKIVAGNLDVALYHTNGTDTDEEVTDTTKLFDEVALWEPGAMVWEKLTVRNLGSLALKYTLSVNVSDVSVVNGKSLADVLKVAVMTEQPTRDNIKTATTQDLETFALKGEGVLDAKTGVDTFYVAIYWAPTADDNDYNIAGEQLYATLGVNLLATQATVEKDSFNNQYDANAKYDVDIWDGKTVTAPVADADGVYHITSAADLVGMMNVTGNSIYKGKTIVLDNNIDLGGRTVKGIGGISANFAGVFDGQGYTISNFKVDSTENSFYAGLFNQVSHGGTIKNLTVKNATIVGNSMVGAVASSLDNAVIDNCKAIDCTLIGVKKVGAVVGYSAGSTVTNNYAENCTVIYSEKEGGEILGYENTGSTVSNNTANNVSVNQGVAVSSADELVALGGTKINGNYILTADIDMTGKAMKSMEISDGAVVNFDGNGHTISNLNLGAAKLNGMTGAGNEVAGLFDLSAPATTVSLTVSDLTVKNATVSCSGFAAAIVGYNSNGGTVITLNNVDVDGATVTADSVAALVAYSTGKVNLNNCDVKGLTLTGEAGRPEKVGAYIGTACTASCVVTVTNCTNGTTYNNYGRVINGATYN